MNSRSATEIDRLVHAAVFGADAEEKGTARWTLRRMAADAGIRPASIHHLYMAIGREEIGGFTVPAFNVRAMAYETARAAARSAKALSAGAFIFEISRSEIGYTWQRPHEYAAVVLGAALREEMTGPIFLQGDHVQINAAMYNGADRAKELQALRTLIEEEIAAGFYNIDVDASMLVDLEKKTLDEQQAVNAALAADFTAFIRERQPHGVTISVGGEIGEIGGTNSDVRELHAFLKSYNAALERRGPEYVGLSKISVQTGTAHGGFINADGTLRMDVKLDLAALEELSRVARTCYGLGGAVQHGASTLPPDAFDAFPRVGACEIHLATSFQNIVFDHAQFPAPLRDEMYAWLKDHAAGDRHATDTDAQFVYKARKKAVGPFKAQMWSVSDDRRRAIARSLEDQFTVLMRKLKVDGTKDLVAKYATGPSTSLEVGDEIAAAC